MQALFINIPYVHSDNGIAHNHTTGEINSLDPVLLRSSRKVLQAYIANPLRRFFKRVSASIKERSCSRFKLDK